MNLYKTFFIIGLAVLSSKASFAQKTEENFQSFLKRFETDSAFQMSRLLDSVIVVYTSDIIIDDDGNGYTENYESSIAKTNWKIKKLENKENSVWEVKELENGITELTMTGIQSGVLVTIEFILQDGLWFLRKYGDYST